MRASYRCLLAAMVVTTVGCQTNSSALQSWFPLAQRDKAGQNDATVAELIPAAGQPDAAEQPGERRPSAGPSIAQARLKRLVSDGQAAIRDQRYEDATTAFEEVLAAAPDHTTAHHGLAIVADLTEDWTKAEHHYKQALRQQPRDANLLNDLGYSYLLQDRFFDASRYLNQAVEMQPQHEHAQINLATLALKQGDRDEAMSRLSQLFDPATALQHLTRLESQHGISSPNSRIAAAGSPELPPKDATVEEVMALAAQHRRAAQAARQQRDALQMGSDQVPAASAQTNPMGSHNQNAANQSVAGLVSAPPPAATAPPLHQPQVSDQNVLRPDGRLASNPNVINTLPNVTPHRMVTTAATPGMPTAAPSPYGQNAQMTSNQPAQLEIQPLGMAVPVRPNGPSAMQAAGSTGQAAAAAQVQSPYYANQTAAPQPGGQQQMASAMPPEPAQAIAYQSSPTMMSGGAASPQNSATAAPMASSPYPAMPLQGLNAGPGSLFPVNSHPGTHSSVPAADTAASQGLPTTPPYGAGASPHPSHAAAPQTQVQRMAPGENSLLNGAMFPPVPRMMPGQQPTQMMNGANVADGQSVQQGSNPSFPAGWVQQPGMQPGVGGGVPNSPSRALSAPDPMSEYERQLRQQDSQYNQTLDQMAAGSSAVQPVQARY
jgi:Flp pilus assembly protein TadD